MKVKEAEIKAKQALQSIYEPREAAVISDLLLEHLTSLRRVDRIVNGNDPLSGEQEVSFLSLLARLLRHEPIQYITHRCWFYGMELYVDKNVLIPRPETEELVEWIVSDCEIYGSEIFVPDEKKADRTSLLKILDVGTGSGCIPLALKKAMPKAEIWGCDISEEALDVARRNSSVLNLRVDFQGIDFLEAQQHQSLPSVDVLVSNPPYIPLAGRKDMKPNVVAFEPHQALFVPDNDPFIFYKALARFAQKRLHPKGRIYVEVHEDLLMGTVSVFNQMGFENVEMRKDLQGKDRMVRITT